ncbi:MAG: DnaD domain protein [Bacilli bacterium]
MNKDNKKLVVESLFINEAVKSDLSLNEFLLLMYFDNSFDLSFDIKVISEVLKMDEGKILEAYSKLLQKNLIKVSANKDNFGKVSEKVSLENFYNKIRMQASEKEKSKEKEDIFSIFEKGFGRTLSGMDYEIINAWIEKGFSEELIIAALKEATYNGVASLRYIDKVLYEWNRKGLKSPVDVNNHLKNDDEDETIYETKVLNFNWLDETK